MSNKVYRGTREVKAAYRGVLPVKAIYKGSTLLWQAVKWLDPVQTGSNLYIPMAYSITQNGSNLKIK